MISDKCPLLYIKWLRSAHLVGMTWGLSRRVCVIITSRILAAAATFSVSRYEINVFVIFSVGEGIIDGRSSSALS